MASEISLGKNKKGSSMVEGKKINPPAGTSKHIGDVNTDFIGHVDTSLTKVREYTQNSVIAVDLLKVAFIKRHAQSAGPSSKPPTRVITASNPITKRRMFYEEENGDDSDIPEARKRMDDMHILATRGTDADEVMQ
ncbi:hypothetical protein B0H11DRAFT_1939663 [Mycena galericulata]|nr:hypothetical protein B0H11DRAFT_1939663 [Mycena galericulata]